MAEIKKGDQVQLKSGGPIMTVQSLDDYSAEGIGNGAMCVWFGDKNQPMEKVFDVETLVIYLEEQYE